MTDDDAWILRGPDEHPSVMMEACETCQGTGKCLGAGGVYDCPECDGEGEIEVTLDEPDGDYLYERARDRQMEDLD